MKEERTGRGMRIRRAALLAALAGVAALALALAPGANAGIAGSSTLTVTGFGAGSGNVRAVQTIYGGQYSSAVNCTWNGFVNAGVCNESVPFGEPPEAIVQFRATAGANSAFGGWTITPANNIVSGCGGTSATCYVQIDGDTTVAAAFGQAPGFPLTVVRQGPAADTAGVSVTSTSVPPQVPQINCGTTCSQTYNAGTIVTLTANVPAGVTFGGWSGPQAPPGCGTNLMCAVTVNQVSTVIATFNQQTFPLTVNVTGEGGVVSNVQPGIHCGDGGTQCTFNFASGSQVTLTATPDSGFTFQGWSGPCSGTGTCVVTMSQAQTVTAAFAGTTVQANVNRRFVTYNGPPGRQRVINVRVTAQQEVSVRVRLSRGGKSVTRTVRGVEGTETLQVFSLPNRVKPGPITVQVTFTNQSGTTKQAATRNVYVGPVR